MTTMTALSILIGGIAAGWVSHRIDHKNGGYATILTVLISLAAATAIAALYLTAPSAAP